jgi:hypothetical protein
MLVVDARDKGRLLLVDIDVLDCERWAMEWAMAADEGRVSRGVLRYCYGCGYPVCLFVWTQSGRDTDTLKGRGTPPAINMGQKDARAKRGGLLGAGCAVVVRSFVVGGGSSVYSRE